MAGEARAQELIVGCLTATAAVAAGSALASGNLPGIRLVIGLGATGVGLATVSMFAPDLAGGLAALILTTTVFVYGTPLMNAITTLTAGTKAGSTTATPAPTKEGSISV